MKLSKKYKAALEVADLTKDYSLVDAVSVLAKLPKSNFDETVEVSIKMGVDPRQGDQMVRGTVMLPHGNGKVVRVLAFTNDPEAAIAAGATHAGLEDMIAKVQDGFLDFDVAVATPDAMKDVRKVARVLGPKGMMPNPKAGTVAEDISKAIKEVMAGRVEFKIDKTAALGVGIAKRSFTEEQILENVKALMDALAKVRPSGLKNRYITKATLTATMQPGIRLASSEYSQI